VSRDQTRQPGADDHHVDLPRQRALTGAAEHSRVGVRGQLAGAEEDSPGGGAAQQRTTGQGLGHRASSSERDSALEHNRDMAHNERVVASLRRPTG
jgi:hypothetical protein